MAENFNTAFTLDEPSERKLKIMKEFFKSNKDLPFVMFKTSASAIVRYAITCLFTEGVFKGYWKDEL